jgi:hypothetical protein
MIYRTNKIKYNTETGILILSKDLLRHPYKDSKNYFEADLYKTRSGEFFLYGWGGVLTVFRGQRDAKILPLTKDEAKEIAKEYMRSQEYKKEFLR